MLFPLRLRVFALHEFCFVKNQQMPVLFEPGHRFPVAGQKFFEAIPEGVGMVAVLEVNQFVDDDKNLF